RQRKRKKKLGYGTAGVVGAVFLGFLAMQLFQGGGSYRFSEAQLNNQPMLGSENASVTIVEFYDYKCPYCRQFETGERSGPNQPANPGVFEKLKKNYISTGKVKFYAVNRPLHDGAGRMAEAAECVYNQDREAFWEYNYAIFADRFTGGDSTDYLVNLARNRTEGLNYSKMRSCIESGAESDEVQRDLRIARATPGPTVTPKVFVNGKYVRDWSYRNLEKVIESELK
ncbi:MAG: DsbA family protein, partial [Candidatus Nanohaloarchaea archaeon]